MRRALLMLASVIVLLGAETGVSDMYPRIAVDPAIVRVVVNPYGNAPLVALIVVSESAGIARNAVHRIDVAVADEDGQVMSWTLPYGSDEYEANFDTSDLPDIPIDDLVVPILGLAPDATSVVSIEIVDEEAQQRYVYATKVTTVVDDDSRDRLRDGQPDITVVRASESRMEPE